MECVGVDTISPSTEWNIFLLNTYLQAVKAQSPVK